MQDPQSMPGNLCPLNRFNVADYASLQTLETAAAYQRGRELEQRGISGGFDSPHLQAIHRYLFQDVFPWAGQLRAVNIAKNGSQFGPVAYIGSALAETLAKLKEEGLLAHLTRANFCLGAAFYLGEINAIHPFREGNGRTQREFIRELAVQAGHPLSWAGFTQQQMVEASIASHVRGDNSGLAGIIEAALLSTRGAV
jgi:cell filamentation protein